MQSPLLVGLESYKVLKGSNYVINLFTDYCFFKGMANRALLTAFNFFYTKDSVNTLANAWYRSSKNILEMKGGDKKKIRIFAHVVMEIRILDPH